MSAKLDAKADSTTNLSWRIDNWFTDIPRDQNEKLKKIDSLVKIHNKTVSLISLKTLPLADVIHFSDSIIAVRALVADNPGIDTLHCLLGGSGFPAVVAAVLYPRIKVVVVEPDQKKCDFLKMVASDCGLPNLEVRHGTIESIKEGTAKYSVVRGVANISKIILAARKCTAPKGVLYHMKGEQWSLEVGEIPTQLCSIWEPSLVKEYKLPVGEVRFALIKTVKI